MTLTAKTRKVGPEEEMTEMEMGVRKETNDRRRDLGLAKLETSSHLNISAWKHAVHMARVNNLSHRLNNRSSADRAKRQGYHFKFLAENIAVGHRSAEHVVDRLMLSPGHRKNIVNDKYTQIGVGAVKQRGRWWFVQVFGHPLGDRCYN